MEIRRAVCPHDCPDTCGMLVYVDGRKVVKVQGDPAHPYTRGVLCYKVAHYEKTVHSPDRISQPLVRDGTKGEGLFRSVTWEQAIEIIVEKWRTIIEAVGAEAILPVCAGGNMGLIQRNARASFLL